MTSWVNNLVINQDCQMLQNRVCVSSGNLIVFPDTNDEAVTVDYEQTLTNKTLNCDLNTILNITNDNISETAAIDTIKIGDGSVSNSEFQHLNGVTSSLQNQIDAKATNSHIHAAVDITSGTLGVVRGGTGAGTLTSGNFLQGNGTGSVTATKAAPSGAVVGTTDAQTLTNKIGTSNTNNYIARQLWVNSGAGSVSTYTAAPPTTGQVLTATGTTTATWQKLPQRQWIGGAEISKTSGSYAHYFSFTYSGTIMFNLTSIHVIAKHSSASDYSVRIYDLTNAKVICEITGQTNSVKAIKNMGTLSNLPTGESIWEIQGLRTGNGSNSCEIYGALLE
jgi:hypothetical protein